MSKTVLAWLALLLIVTGGTGLALALKYSRDREVVSGSGGMEADREYRRVPASGKATWLTEFELTERSGKRLGTAELKGRIHVVNFFFSTCPQTCLLQNKTLEGIQRQYGPKGVQFVGITCDPVTDTPSTLRDYASRHFPAAGDSWWFLTGDMLYIRRIAAEIYRVPLDERTHTERFLVIDKWGHDRGQFHWSKPEELTDLRRLLDKLLAEKTPPPELAETSPKAGTGDESSSAPTPAPAEKPAQE
jgi:cytochrome oxidase Cu insertion factor (SCO1/SenC/PrrC family)